MGKRTAKSLARVYVNLSKSSIDDLNKMVEMLGQAQVTTLSRLVAWFAKQDREFQLAVATNHEAAMQEFIRLQAMRLMNQDPAHMTADEAAATIRFATTRLHELAKGAEKDKEGRSVLQSGDAGDGGDSGTSGIGRGSELSTESRPASNAN